MADNTAIPWADATWNLVAGCTRVSPACDHCYGLGESWRMASNPNGKIRETYRGAVFQYEGRLDWTGQVRTLPERLDWPLRWRKPRRIFPCSLSDLFHERVPFRFRCAAYGIMALTPHHTYCVLTKRVDEAQKFHAKLGLMADEMASAYPGEKPGWWRWDLLRRAAVHYLGTPLPAIPSETPPWPLPNVWIGATVEDEGRARQRIPLLLQVSAAVHWVSYEPALGPVDWRPWLSDVYHLDWLVAGGETGAGARPAHPDWFRSARDACASAGVPFFLKSWGDWLPIDQVDSDGYQCGGYGRTSTRDRVWTVHWGKMPGYDPKKDTRMSVDRVECVCVNDDPRGVGGESVLRVGKKAAGHLLDGAEHRAFPGGV